MIAEIHRLSRTFRFTQLTHNEFLGALRDIDFVKEWADRLRGYSGFIAAILAAPADINHRLIFADKLEEDNLSDVAGWLRLDIEVTREECAKVDGMEYKRLAEDIKNDVLVLFRKLIPALWTALPRKTNGCHVCGNVMGNTGSNLVCSLCDAMRANLKFISGSENFHWNDAHGVVEAISSHTPKPGSTVEISGVPTIVVANQLPQLMTQEMIDDMVSGLGAGEDGQ